TNLDLDPLTFRRVLLSGQLLGRYDARIAAPSGSALAAGGDPSSSLIAAPFAAAARRLFTDELGYVATAGYTTLSSAINSWDFRHDGRPLPDAIVDLGAALARRPGLRVLSLAGYHDVATPFRQTELDLARLGARPTLFTRVYAGGHMTYLDDASRPRLKADIAAFVQGTPMVLRSDASVPSAAPAAPLAARPEAATSEAVPPTSWRAAATASPAEATSSPAFPLTLDRGALAQGGDPWLPPASRVRPSTTSPRGAALAARVQAKIVERDRDVYR
ncbi:MAG TPA: hypothetical protein VLD35_15090, partial [Caldimonas sp.]|nr:hypothetical protein [Caldimonas sp.]